MRAIVTVLGSDRVGVVAAISKALADCNINILDIQQGVLQDVFAMVMLVDVSGMTQPFPDVKETLREVGRQIGMDVRIQREDIFEAMNRI